ncbi:hypothetical protein [Rurimicrobium arvi]|uniref:Uncharacterized protein n=1 Tax=Rurimicrobium arvi TaxID=2049916 RepID=A0ABP8MVW0_9BACT
MASFSLRSQRTGQYKEFSLLEILYLLGDRVNDEIFLEDGEDVYNLSSFREIGSGSGQQPSGGNWSMEAPVPSNGQSVFLLQYNPSGAVLLVLLNGLAQNRGNDFSLQGREIRFSFPLSSRDSLQFLYQFQ